MKKRISIIFTFSIFIAILAGACSVLKPRSTSSVKLPEGEAVPAGPVLITGGFEYSNDFVVETYYTDHAVALLDMTGFVLRDFEWELPVEGQVLGYMDLDADNNRATFRLSLPSVPEGQFNDVDNDKLKEQGVQVFAVGYSPNVIGNVFSVGDDRSFGWSGYLASVTVDRENQDEVIGGKLVVWAADASQSFPSSFGADGLLFTGDDPVMALPAGYAIIDLDQEPFAILRDQVNEITLYEPADVAIKDFSKQSYSEAFDSMFEIVRREYAFNGVEGKQPDWDALYGQVAPAVAKAQSTRDGYAYYLALRQFIKAFNDGHVYFDWNDYQYQYYFSEVLPGFGFAIRELDSGEALVMHVTPGSAAEKGGLKVGDFLTEVNGEPVQQVISSTPPIEPQSTDFGRRFDQAVAMLRAPMDTKKQFTFETSSGRTLKLTLTAFDDRMSYFAAYPIYTTSSDMPAEYRILDEGIGYIKVSTFYDDLGLIWRIFEHALKYFTNPDIGVVDLIIDLRQNGGGASLGFAGYFYDEEIPMGQREYYSDTTGKFEPDGPRDKVRPNETQYDFDTIVVLVDQFCASACEMEAYGLSQVPGVEVIGQTPTGGIEAEVSRGQFELPDGISLTVPTGRYTLPDGSILLEGQGVPPTIRVPVDEGSVLSGEDVVLQEAISYILGAAG
jgi:C-terminal processing protease CtpA/Prc